MTNIAAIFANVEEISAKNCVMSKSVGSGSIGTKIASPG